MDKLIIKVDPIILYPPCIKDKGYQEDCRKCGNIENCWKEEQPRSLCIKTYPGHPEGCPNYGKNEECPPKIPAMYDWIFDTRDVYAVITEFDLLAWYEYRRKRKPYLPEGQIKNKMYWQTKDKAKNELAVKDFYKQYPEKKDYVYTNYLECMGVHLVKTLEENGINLEFPVKDFSRRISLVAKVYEEALTKYGFYIKEKEGTKKLKRILSKD